MTDHGAIRTQEISIWKWQATQENPKDRRLTALKRLDSLDSGRIPGEPPAGSLGRADRGLQGQSSTKVWGGPVCRLFVMVTCYSTKMGNCIYRFLGLPCLKTETLQVGNQRNKTSNSLTDEDFQDLQSKETVPQGKDSATNE